MPARLGLARWYTFSPPFNSAVYTAFFGCFRQPLLLTPTLANTSVTNILVGNGCVGKLYCGQSWEPLELEVR